MYIKNCYNHKGEILAPDDSVMTKELQEFLNQIYYEVSNNKENFDKNKC